MNKGNNLEDLDPNHVALNAAIDEIAATTILSRDEATTVAMNFPDAGFLLYFASIQPWTGMSLLSVAEVYHAWASAPRATEVA